MSGLGLEVIIIIAIIGLAIYFIKKKALNIWIIIVLILPFAYASLQIVMEYDGNDFKAASNTSIEGFVCKDKNQTLTAEQQKQREQRIKDIYKAIDDSIGLTFGGHDIPAFTIQPRTKHLYRLQSKFSIEDWELLSDMYISKKYNTSYNRSAIFTMFTIGGEKVIAILECKANAKNISSDTKGSIKYLIDVLNSSLNSYGVQQVIKRIREEEKNKKWF
jgi:hypothetical protein